jgi:hypothetical protein
MNDFETVRFAMDGASNEREGYAALGRIEAEVERLRAENNIYRDTLLHSNRSAVLLRFPRNALAEENKAVITPVPEGFPEEKE